MKSNNTANFIATIKPMLHRLKPYRFSLLIVVLSTLVMLSPTQVWSFLRYQHNAVDNAEIWRILTANLCHSNWYHLLLNMLGLLIMDFILKPVLSEMVRIKLLLVTMIGNVLLLHFFVNLNWYVGLSGALHGYLFAGALLSWRDAKKINALILIILSGKVVIENIWQINSSTESLIGTNVVEEAHLFGVVIAITFVAFNFTWQKLTPYK